MADLTTEALELLLNRLDSDSSRSADKYFELRLKLSKYLIWKGCPETKIDDLADEVFDRVAAKLASGEKIENLTAYCHQVLRFVWLESRRKNKEDGYGDEIPKVPVYMDLPEEMDQRIACLRSCLTEVAPNEKDRRLIIGYYDNQEEKTLIKRRKSLAEFFGLKMNALKVKACRLRARLEICIKDCLEKHNSVVTK